MGFYSNIPHFYGLLTTKRQINLSSEPFKLFRVLFIFLLKKTHDLKDNDKIQFEGKMKVTIFTHKNK